MASTHSNLNIGASIALSLPAIFFTLLTVVLIGGLYRLLLPKPLPGIPYNRNAARSIFGDLPSAISHVIKTGTISSWMLQQAKQLQSPVIQVFPKLFQKPLVSSCSS
jgi:hypothetical protein